MRKDFRLVAWLVFFGTLGPLPLRWNLDRPNQPRIHVKNARPVGRYSHRARRWEASFRRLRNQRGSVDPVLGLATSVGTGTGTGQSNVVIVPVPQGSELSSYMNQYTGVPVWLLLAGGAYTLNETLLSATISGLKIAAAEGQNNTTNPAVVTVTAAITTADSTDFTDTEWCDLTIKSGVTTANAGLFKGYGNARNWFHDNYVVDFGPRITHTHGLGFRFERNVINTVTPPANVNSNVIGCLSLYCRENEWNFNASTANGNGGGILVGGAGSPLAGQSFGTWWVENNRVFDSNQANFCLDTFFDCEADQATVAPRFIVTGNIVYNAKIAFNTYNTGSTIFNNTCRITTNALAQTNAGCGILQFSTPGSGTTVLPGATLTVAFNVITQDNVASVTWDWRCINLALSNQATDSFGTITVFHNFIVANGQAAVPANAAGPLGVSIANNAGAAATTCDFLDICDNSVGMTAVPGATPSCAYSVSDLSAIGTFNHIRFRGNRVLGVTSGAGFIPGTVVNCFTNVLSWGATGKTITCNELNFDETLAGEQSGANWVPTASNPFLLTSRGTNVVAKFTYRGNTPRLSNFLAAQSAAGNVLTFTVPAGFPDMDVRITMYVNITTLGAPNTFQAKYTITPETSGGPFTTPLQVSTPTTGAWALSMAEAGPHGSASLKVRVKNNTTLTLLTGATTPPTTFNVGAEIEVLGN